MGDNIRTLGELVIQDYKTGVIIAIGELIEIKIVTLYDGRKEFHADVIEISGSLKESAGEKISDLAESEDET